MSFYEELLQSAAWQAFQEKNGKYCLREQGVLFVMETLPVVGQYLYAPRWPSSEMNQEARSKNQEKLARRENVGWVRVEPESDRVLAELQTVFGKNRIVPAPHDVQPREILVLDISGSTEDLLAQMKSKTRYNIRLSEKHGVTVRFSRSEEDLEPFINLIYATTERKAICPHPKSYYRNFFEAFQPEQCVLAMAEHEGKILAANLIVFHERTAYYLHGGSSDEGRHLMAPYLLQWRSIEEAKRRSCTRYDFGGVRTKLSPIPYHPSPDPWSGITRFKQGFAPHAATLSFPGAYDIVIASWTYRLYRFLQKLQSLRKLFR